MADDKRNWVQTTVYIPEEVLDAMNIVWQHDCVRKSNQIQLGVLYYLYSQHRDLLKNYGYDLWGTWEPIVKERMAEYAAKDGGKVPSTEQS